MISSNLNWSFWLPSEPYDVKIHSSLLNKNCPRPSPPIVINFSYFAIRFLLNSSIVKSDNKIGKVNDKKNMI